MRLAFWRAGKDKALVQRAIARPAAPAASKPVSEAVPTSRSDKPAAAFESGDLDLRTIWQALRRKRSWIIVPTVLAAALSMSIVNLVTPRYKSEARILIDGRENIFLRPNGERNDERNALDPEAVTSQVQLLLSRELVLDPHGEQALRNPYFDLCLTFPSCWSAYWSASAAIRYF